VLTEYDLQAKAHELNMGAARLARQAAEGSMGPATKAITVTGGVTFPDLIANYYEQAKD
jgi:5-methyltetrahydrofolate--homocysteine methyltransferase